jgi:hypothetical protein
MTLSQRPIHRSGRSRARSVAAPVACEFLERRAMLSGTAAGAVDTSTAPTTDTTVDAAAATDVKTSNGHQYHFPCHRCWA